MTISINNLYESVLTMGNWSNLMKQVFFHDDFSSKFRVLNHIMEDKNLIIKKYIKDGV
jgi:hypothetical protein